MKNNRFKNLKISLVVKNKSAIESEKVFSKTLNELPTVQIPSSIEVFAQDYKIEKLSIAIARGEKAVDKKFILMQELELLIKNQNAIKEHVKNITIIFKEEKISAFQFYLNTKKNLIPEIGKTLIFTKPTYEILLQKKGKFLNKTIFRKCFLNIDSFGQIKSDKDKKPVKPSFYRNYETKLEAKEKMDEFFKNQEDLKKKKLSVKKVMKWPEKKEIENYNLRLRFSDPGTKKEKCIYFKTMEFAIRTKNNAIYQKMMFLNPNPKIKLKVFSSIWRIKQIEYFYENHLKKFFSTDDNFKKIINEQIIIKNSLKQYFVTNYPNLYDSGYKKSEKLDFYDNSHIKLKKTKTDLKKSVIQINLLDSKIFATVINPGAHFLLKQDNQFIQENEENFLNPFTQINDQLIFSDTKFEAFIKNFDFQDKPKNITNKSKHLYFDFLAKNSTIIINFHKLLVKNNFEEKEFTLDKNIQDEFIFNFNISVEKGNSWADTLSFNERITRSYFCFELRSSFKVDFNNMKTINVTVTDREKKEVYEKSFNLFNHIEDMFLENNLFVPIEFEYKGCKLSGIFQIQAILIPRNLEISHLFLNKKILDQNFEDFAEILRKCQDFSTYKKFFFHKDYFSDIQVSDCYFLNKNNFLLQKNQIAQNQENLFIHSHSPLFLQITKTRLVSIAMLDISISRLTTNSIKNLKNKIKFGDDLLNDFFFHLTNLVSFPERVFIYQSLFGYVFKNFLNLNLLYEEEFYSYDYITYLNQEILIFLQQNSSLNNCEKFLFYKLVFKCYLVLNSNSFEGKKYEMFFSTKYFNIILKIIQVNRNNLSDNDLLFIILVQILTTKHLSNYSEFFDLVKINTQLNYFKLIMKRCFLNEFEILNSFMIDYDDFLINGFFNSFADLIDALYFQMFCDLKNYLCLIFIIQDSNLNILDQLKKIEMPVSSFLDILFFVFFINQNIKKISLLKNDKFEAFLKSEINNCFTNFEEVLIGILGLIKIMNENNFFLNDVIIMKRQFLITQQKKNKNLKNLNFNLKKLKIHKDTLKNIIVENINQSEELKGSIVSVFQKFDQNLKKDFPKIEKENTQNLINNSFIEEDVYFEIARDPSQLELKGIQSTTKLSSNSLKMYLNNLEHKISDLSHNNGIWDNLHNCLNYDIYQFQEIARKFFNCNEIQQMELYNDLSMIFDSKRISIFQLLVPIILYFSNNNKDIEELILLLCQSLSLIFVDKQNFLFDQIIAFIINEVNMLSPFLFCENRILNRIRSSYSKQTFFIKNGFMMIEDIHFDIKNLILKNYESHTLVYKKNCFHFNSFFCDDLEEFFELLIQKKEINRNFEKFNIFVEIQKLEKIQNFEIPFKINFESNKIQIISKIQEPIYFEEFYTEENMIENKDDLFLNLYKQNWHNFYKFPKSIKRNIDFVKQKFAIKFKFKDQLFLTVNVGFGDKNERITNNLISWNFLKKDNLDILKFEKDEIKIIIAYQYFFLDFQNFLQFVKLASIEKLKQNDVFKFIQLNSNKMDLYTTKGKKIDEKLHIFNIADYELAFKNQTLMTFYAVFDK